MSSPDAQWTVLVAHPDTPREPVWGIAVELRLASATTLVCTYSLHGDLERVRFAGGGAGRRADSLWEHTCFEAFVAAPGAPGYYEFNFSPTSAWAAYQFREYRQGREPASVSQPPGLQVRKLPGQLELVATVHLGGLAPLRGVRRLRVALAAVVEDDEGRYSYWALEHPPGRPDFHHADGFTMDLALP